MRALFVWLFFACALPAFAGGVVAVQFDPAFPRTVRERVVALLAATGTTVRTLPPGATAPDSAGLVLAFGDAPLARTAVPDALLAPLGPEGFAVRLVAQGGARIAGARGNAADDGRGRTKLYARGHLFAAYALLERLGFAFLHPLQPIAPPALAPLADGLDVRERPHWPVRGLHLHTMHPLELTHVLNGWGPNGPADEAGFGRLTVEWERFCEWMLASRQNTVQWILLEDTSWSAFAQSPVRQRRLTKLVQIAHAHGLVTGIDVPIALEQQNSFRLIRRPGTDAEELAQMQERIDWLADCGFDLISTELGFSEFHAPDDRKMVLWLDEMTKRAALRGMIATTKAHVSMGQTAAHYPDPDTGKPINFNFLSIFADKRLGVLVHTVQHYGLDDPAPTYDRQDFKDLHHFMRRTTGSRPVLWYPETAYWVSFDVDVPLFLPVYAERRVHDLRLIAKDETAGKRIDGQMIFSSGWEWGYWLNDLVTARAAWNPELAAASDAAATEAVLTRALAAFGPGAAGLARELVGYAGDQHRLLIRGQFGAAPPESVVRRNGQAYLQGCETWDDVGALAARIPGVPAIKTQPDKMGLLEVDGPFDRRRYEREVEPLLAAMETTFEKRTAALAALAGAAPAHLAPTARELADASRITFLRARQVHALYDRASGRGNSEWSKKRFLEAQAALDAATVITKDREAHYRVAPDRIAGWAPNPTSYAFAYLWTARTLHFWWRDEGKVAHRPRSPCYLNVIHPAEVATAEGAASSVYQRVERIIKVLGPAARWLEECIHPPAAAPDHRRLVRPAGR